jgi:hypothetical protein
MRGERGELIRAAAIQKKKDEIQEKEKNFYLFIWIIRILAYLTDSIISFMAKNYNGNTFESTKPDIFKTGNEERKPKDINELQRSRLLRDAELWD